MNLSPEEDERYDRHLGTAAETAFACGNEQLAALLADCHIVNVTYMDTLISLSSDEMSTGVRVFLEAPVHVTTRLSRELISELQGLLNSSLYLEGETVLDITVSAPPAADGWRERVIPSLNLDGHVTSGN